MTDLKALVARRRREHGNGHAVNTTALARADRVHADEPGANTPSPSRIKRLAIVFTRSSPEDGERVNTPREAPPEREHAGEHGVNATRTSDCCRYCGGPMGWPAPVGLVF